MSSSASSGVSDAFGNRGYRGIPRRCMCGESSVIRTSSTEKNPGRLFHCCPYRTEQAKSHLFKWTDEFMVEEIEFVEGVVANLEKEFHAVQSEMFTLACETRTCEAVVNSFGKKIEAIEAIQATRDGLEREILEMKDIVKKCENEIEGLKSFKNMVVCCGLVICVVYFFFLA